MNEHAFPISSILGDLASALGIRPSSGLVLSETGGGELAFTPTQTRDVSPTVSEWDYQEANGGLALRVVVERLDAFAAGTMRTTISNRGPVARRFRTMRICLDFDQGDGVWSFKTCGGGAMEGTYPPAAFEIHERATLFDSYLKIGSDADGRSSNKDLPLMIARRGTGEEAPGFWYGLEWSGEWTMSASHFAADNHRFRADAGIPVNGLTLEPGEELVFPALHIGTFTGGFAEGTNALRRYLYQHLQPAYLGERPYPRVSYDHWFGLGNDINFERLKPQVDAAAVLGVEMWCLDAGWNGDFEPATGNWEKADPSKFPEGLRPLADYVRSKGMRFGLWIEPERAYADTWAVRTHPELFIRSPDPNNPQCLLNLARRDAQDWMIALLDRWITDLDLRWSRFDFNIRPAAYWHAADPTGKIQFAYVAGLFRVLDEVMRRHPQWMIESTASGGRRIDLGMLARLHTIWLNDWTFGPQTPRWMHLRAQQFLPGNCMNTTVRVSKGAGDPADLDHQVISHATAQLSFDGDMAGLSAKAAARCRLWTDHYKQYRHILAQDFHQLSRVPESLSDWDVVQWSAYDGNEGLLAAFRIDGECEWRGSMHGLAADADYGFTDLATGRHWEVAGEMLSREGMTIKLVPHSACLWRWRRHS